MGSVEETHQQAEGTGALAGAESQREGVTEAGLIYADTPHGFGIFYSLIHNQNIPAHAMDWAKGFYKARANDKGTVLEAFRGSTKTTTGATFIAYQVGLHPEKSCLLLQVSEQSAKDNTLAIANIIEHNPAWKQIFPHVVPDKERGWGADGYWVKVEASDYPYEEWIRKTSENKDPTLLGLGRTSRTAIGRHPTGVLYVDDLDDENTTRSDRELEKTRDVLTGTVFPTAATCDWTMIVGTPWNEQDTIHYCLSTGQFEHLQTPVYKEDGTPVWPEVFDEAAILKQRALAGEIQFARMFLLDLEAAKGKILKKEWISHYPHEEIKEDWPEFMGVDYASTSDKQRQKVRDRDYFALAIGRLTPQQTLIITDGWYGHVSKQEAIQKIIGMCSVRPYLRGIGFEAIGTGKDVPDDLATAFLLAQDYVPIMPIHTHGKKSKGARFEGDLAVMFQQGRVMLSTKMTAFLKSGLDQWVSWDGTDTKHDDILDSWYMLLQAVLMHTGMALPQLQRVPEPHQLFRKTQRQSAHPLANMGRW